MSLDDYIRGLFNLPSPSGRGQKGQRSTWEKRDEADFDDSCRRGSRGGSDEGGGSGGGGGGGGSGIPPQGSDGAMENFYDFDMFVRRQMQSMFAPFFGGGRGGGGGIWDHDDFRNGQHSSDDQETFSNRSTDDGWSGPRIHVWTWQDTRDEFGDDDRFGGGWDGGGGGGGGSGGGGLFGGFGGGDDGIIGGGDDGGDDEDGGCDCHLLPGEGNENWHSNPRDGLDLFRELFGGGGLDGWFRTVIPPGHFESHRGFRQPEEGNQDSMFLPGRRSLRDSMLSKPILGDSENNLKHLEKDFFSPPDNTPPPPPPPQLPVQSPPDSPVDNPAPSPPIKRDETLDFKSDAEKRQEIERILSSSSSSSSRDGLFRRSPPPPPPPPSPSDIAPYRPSPGWSSLFPRRFWDGWFSNSDLDFGGRSEPSDRHFNWSGSFGNSSFSSSFTSTRTATTVKADGTEETVKTVKDGSGLTETTTRRKGSRGGSVRRFVDGKTGEEIITRSGDQSLF